MPWGITVMFGKSMVAPMPPVYIRALGRTEPARGTLVFFVLSSETVSGSGMRAS
jgi:hypothetical protein